MPEQRSLAFVGGDMHDSAHELALIILQVLKHMRDCT